MTLEEAKKILEKEFAVIGIHKSTEPFEFDESGWIEHEKPSVLEAFRVLSKEGYYVTISGHDYNMRKKRLEKEYEKNTKAPGPGEEQPKEGDLKAATKMFGAQAREIMRLTAENAELRETIDKMKEGNPALKEALKESATQFNDALLDEQGKKIEKLANENERLKDQIAVLDACKKHNDKIDRKQIKCLGKEIAKLNGIIHDKNAVLADVAEELRLSKIREKNLTEVCHKYVKEVEDLREQLADKVVDKIDAQALKSAESALAWKEKVIAEKDMALAYYEKKIAEKDEVIDNLRKELTESKKRVEWVRNASKEYCDYGVAANEFIKKLSRLYILASNNGNIDVEMLERCKNYQTYGFPANCNRETKKEINDIARGKENKKPRIPTPEEPKHDNGFEDFINKAIDNYNRRAAELGCAGSKDGNGIFDQMVGVDIAEEGEDHSGVIVLCGKDFIDSIKKMK